MKAVFALLLQLLLPFSALFAGVGASAAETPLVKPQIPAQAKKFIVDIDNGVFSIKGEVLSLSPVLQIRDAQNRLKLSQSLSGRYSAAVLFDNYGAATRIWLLAAN